MLVSASIMDTDLQTVSHPSVFLSLRLRLIGSNLLLEKKQDLTAVTHLCASADLPVYLLINILNRYLGVADSINHMH